MGTRYILAGGNDRGTKTYWKNLATVIEHDKPLRVLSCMFARQIERWEKLHNEFYIDLDMIKEAVQNKSCFNLIHLETMFKVDIFILKESPYAREEFSRRRPEIIPEIGEVIQIATPEDLILNKLLWYKEGGSVAERQWNDAKGILKVQGILINRTYLEQWAKVLLINSLLEKLWQETYSD